jgi:peptide/nickel transport system substrate-binding protein
VQDDRRATLERRRAARIRLLSAVALILLTAALAPISAEPLRGGTLTVGLPYDIDTLNVYSTAELGDVQAAVVEGLLCPDEHARYVPVLAIEVPTLDNGGIQLINGGAAMRVVYHLRAGVKWHDGFPFTSADVKFTWESVRDPRFLAESKDGSQDVASIDTPDDLTAIVNYRSVSPAFASTLFTFGIFPRHLLDGHDLNHDVYNEKPIGTGPFKVSEFKRGQYVVLERNADYWRRDEHGVALPYIDRVIFKIIPSSNTLGVLLRAGDVLLSPRIPYMLAKQLQGAQNLELVSAPSLGWGHLDFGLKPGSKLHDPLLRRAIAQAINRAALVKAAGGYPQAIRSPVVPLLEALYDPAPEALAPSYDPDAANRALDAAGYRRGADGYRSKNGVPLSFWITTRSGEIDGEIGEQIIMAELKAVGIKVTADNKTGIAYREARYRGDFDLLYSRWVTAADPVYSIFYGSHGPLNGQGYASADLDAALARMETSIDRVARRAAAGEFQRTLAHDLPTVPLLDIVSIAAKSRRLKNFKINPTNMTDFSGISTWYLEPLAGGTP